MQRSDPPKRDPDTFFRKFILPEEDKEFRTPKGKWRWFRSENVIDLVRVQARRKQQQQQQRHDDEARNPPAA